MDSDVRIGVDQLFKVDEKLWSHLMCDDYSKEGLAVLHAFAREIGAPEIAFHNPDGHPRPHYDLTPELRARAVEAGAESLDRRGLVDFLKRGRERAAAANPEVEDSSELPDEKTPISQADLAKLLEDEWEPKTGFFGKLKLKGFDKEGYQRVETLLRRIDPKSETLERRLVSVSWFIPLFMSWQDAPGLEQGEYKNYCNRLEQLVMKGLGLP